MGIEFAKIPMHFSFYAFAIAIPAMIPVSLLTAKTSEKVLNDTRNGWYFSK
jgi:hypothetical protein